MLTNKLKKIIIFDKWLCCNGHLNLRNISKLWKPLHTFSENTAMKKRLDYPACIYLLKVNCRNSRTTCEISGVFIIDFKGAVM